MDGGSPDASDLGAPHTFLGLDEADEGPWDVVILPVPYEMTTSWREGTEHGPAATIEVSSQVELYDPILDSELPCGLAFHTAKAWGSDAGTLLEQLASIREYLGPWFDGATFPIVLGGEHGLLPPLVEALAGHPTLAGDLSRLTLVQVDAHADLRDSLNGERSATAPLRGARWMLVSVDYCRLVFVRFAAMKRNSPRPMIASRHSMRATCSAHPRDILAGKPCSHA